MDLITTAPTVVYRCTLTDGTELTINSPADVPEASKREVCGEGRGIEGVWGGEGE